MELGLLLYLTRRNAFAIKELDLTDVNNELHCVEKHSILLYNA